MRYLEWAACVECGLSVWDWESGVYPHDFKIDVIAFYNMRNQVFIHTEDAKASKQKK